MHCILCQLSLDTLCEKEEIISENIREGKYEEVAVEIVTELYVDHQFQH